MLIDIKQVPKELSDQAGSFLVDKENNSDEICKIRPRLRAPLFHGDSRAGFSRSAPAFITPLTSRITFRQAMIT